MLLLRDVTVSRWLPFGVEPLIESGDAPSDCLGDVKTGQGRFSVWRVEEGQRNITRILAALEIGRNTRRKGDGRGYIVFDSAVLDEVGGISTDAVSGDTLDPHANTWHLDLVGFTGLKLVALTSRLISTGVTGTVLWKTLVAEIESGLAEDRFPNPRPAETVLERLRPSA